MVLNDLSLRSPANDIQTAREWMRGLVSTVRAATAKGVNRVLRTHTSFQVASLAPDYPLSRWRNDNEVDREIRRYFNTLITKAPFIADIRDSQIENNILSSEFIYEGLQANGLGVASLLEALAISLRSEQRWESSHLELQANWLQNDGSISTESVVVVHASKIDHVWEHDQWITDRLQTSVHDGTELWSRKSELFPSLSFCEHVGKQMRRLQNGDPMVRPIVRRLSELENYCKGWKSGPFVSESLLSKASPESQSTLQHFSKDRTFQCPDGQERVFSWHVRLTPKAWRILFFPDSETKNIIIGYIGSHLPTAKEPT